MLSNAFSLVAFYQNDHFIFGQHHVNSFSCQYSNLHIDFYKTISVKLEKNEY